jgi:hypothetical protein
MESHRPVLSNRPRSSISPTVLASLACLSIGVAVASAPSIASAQTALRRDAPVQPVALVERGDLLVGFGMAYESGVHMPLVAADGDLARLGTLQLAYGLAGGVLIEVRGDAYLVFRTSVRDEGSGEAAAAITALDPDLLDGVSTGAGDFRVGIAFHGLGRTDGPSLGGRVQFIVPSSDAEKGLGTNSIGVRMSALAGYGRDRWRLSAEGGVAILEAPVEHFEQNDVFVYGAELRFVPIPDRPLRVFLAADGRASTRGLVPVGTEDEGRLSLGADYRVGRWLLDTFGAIGYAGNSPDWGLGAGLAFTIER